MEAISELEQDHPNIGRHRNNHLAVVLGLRFVSRLKRKRVEFRYAIDERSCLVAEELSDLLERDGRVFDRVVEQRCNKRLGVEPKASADRRDADRMADELFTRAAALIAVLMTGEAVGVDDLRFVDRQRALRLALRDNSKEL